MPKFQLMGNSGFNLVPGWPLADSSFLYTALAEVGLKTHPKKTKVWGKKG